MKAITTMCAKNGSASLPAVANGRVQRHRDGENDEIKLYLSKLRELVPFMPKNRKLTKLEVIQNVIDYICELQNALDSHPAVNSFDSLAVLQHQQQHQQQQQQQQQVGWRTAAVTYLPTTVHHHYQGTVCATGGQRSVVRTSPKLAYNICDITSVRLPHEDATPLGSRMTTRD
uniref:BHLH domain-containing protein n=1 Tax=Anopheles maculatus TaxID=74869 RepID=A0A182SMV3_9DIPT